MSRIAVVDALDAAAHRPHALHAEDRIWVEKNCYVDLWIELLHALKLEPTACLPFTLAVDFEGDQWTFFKPPHDELRELYGVDVQELTVWRPLIEHALEHLGAGKWISTEADAFWLPDTAGTDYRRQHTKTTIVLNDIDVAAQRLGYFHNAGYFRLDGEDFIKTFRLDAAGEDAGFLPLFAELVRVDRVVRRDTDELKRHSRVLLHKHLARRPPVNPIQRFGQRFESELPGLQAAGLAHYHRWAFGSIRQLGAAFELAALHLQWLGDADFAPAIDAFTQIAEGNKTLILKAARAVNSRRPLDAAASFGDMAQAWDRGMKALAR
jgi:hypothetical protein